MSIKSMYQFFIADLRHNDQSLKVMPTNRRMNSKREQISAIQLTWQHTTGIKFCKRKASCERIYSVKFHFCEIQEEVKLIES